MASSGGTGAAQQQQRQRLQAGLTGSGSGAIPTEEKSYTLQQQGGLCDATQAVQVLRQSNARRSTRLAMQGYVPVAEESRAAVPGKASGLSSCAGFVGVAELGGRHLPRAAWWHLSRTSGGHRRGSVHLCENLAMT